MGQQVTLSTTSALAAGARVDLLAARATAGDCDLVVKGVRDGEARGWLLVGADTFVGDRVADAPLDGAALRAIAAVTGQELTYTCLPPGTGARAAVDRDEDGFLDRDELDAGTDPADAGSRPAGNPLPLGRILVQSTTLALTGRRADGIRVVFASRTRKDAAANRIAPPPANTAFDPTIHGAELRLYNAAFTSDVVVQTLPASGWRRLASRKRDKGYRFRGRDAGGGPVQSVILGPDTIQVRAKLAYTLDEPAQGRVAIRLVPGLFAGGGWCASTPARARGPQRSTARNDRPGRFVGAPRTAAPDACPPLP